MLFADRGDIVILEGGTRRWITKTTAGEGSPRWARNDTAVTYVRDGKTQTTEATLGSDAKTTDS